jgi:N-acetylglucosaminyldiphosphoundecaprenol N-acetyl-beta-D-mannosaminyltransferase
MAFSKWAAGTESLHLLLKKIRLVPGEAELPHLFLSMSKANVGKPTRVAFVNAHAFNLCCGDSGFLADLLESDFVFRDGSGMAILYRMLGGDPGLNLNGTDMIPRIIGLYAGHKAALFGTNEPYLSRAARAIEKIGVDPVILRDGFQDDEAYLECIQSRKIPLIILAMGMPKQERVAALLARNLEYPCLIVCGGAILDFMGNKVARAPYVFRRLGIEWVYRLAHEPKRLFRCYIIGNFVFLLRSAFLALPTKSASK